MKKYIFLLLALLPACGVIKGHKNPIIDKGIDIANEAYPQDNLIEERIEDAIESFTGLEVDFSPQTDEE